MLANYELEHVDGTVKWFDMKRGFGFIDAPSVKEDVLLHVNVLRNFGQSSVAEGTRIVVAVQNTQRGLQATQVIEIEPPASEASAEQATPDFMADVAADAPFLPARVKWFDKGKGFGFANAFGSHDDIFVHVEVLRRFGLADLQPGEAICLRVMQGERGLLAGEVHRWEHYIAD